MSGPPESEASLALYNKALLLDPTHVGTLVAYGRKLLSLQRSAMAHRYLAAAANRQPHHPAAWYDMRREDGGGGRRHAPRISRGGAADDSQ